MKKILLGLSVFLMTLVSAQNYPDYYPNSSYGSNQYGNDYDDEFYFPDDYYFEYPSDYYTNDLYRDYYTEYRRSISNVNWNRFFVNHNLSRWQVQQIMLLNDSFNSYSAWNSYYRYNPDRWYYDRFYALERILGPTVFVVFQNNYYRGYNPVVYYQKYNRRNYAKNIYVVPRYRTVNVNVYRLNRNEYHQNNSRQNIGFRQTERSGSTSTTQNGFRNDGVITGNTSTNNGFRTDSSTRNTEYLRNQANTRTTVKTESQTQNNNGFRNDRVRTEVQTPSQTPARNQGFRNGNAPSESVQRNNSSDKRAEPSFRTRSNENSDIKTPAAGLRNSGLRFTTR